MENLTGKVAVVTGGGRDIGRATCVKFGENGMSVVVNYLASESAAAETVELVKKAGGDAVAVKADVSTSAGVAQLVSETLKAFNKPVQVLVNNAGGLVGRKQIVEMEESFWDQVITLNLKSVFLVSKAFVPHMADNGSIVNLSTLAARNGGGGGAVAYATAKGGVLTFTRGFAKELKSRHIRVNCVSPGLIDTTFHDKFTPAEARKNTVNATLADREGTAADVANAIFFLATDASSYINGESIEINGGLYFV
ncbi:MAG: SDR family oxidoreductase [Calditrichaeota bacterium]|nr:SDR family oxidoreductase [Calditrichota bacterium]